MIAMALSCNPQLLIADEPTTALDVTIQAQVLELMNDLQHETGAAIILITHDLGVVAEFCRNVLVMYAGNMVEYGSAEQIFSEPRMPYTQGLLASLPRLDELGHAGSNRSQVSRRTCCGCRRDAASLRAARIVCRSAKIRSRSTISAQGHVARCYLYDERARDQRPEGTQELPTVPAGSSA